MSPGSRRASAAVAGTLAGLTLLAGVRPAAAQQDLGSVVCVASELESLAGSGPVRRVIRRDTELVYRVGVDLSGRAEAEQALRAELETAGETSCAWSQPGQSHVVVLSHSGVARQDLTIDPEDPPDRRFAAGYGATSGESRTVRHHAEQPLRHQRRPWRPRSVDPGNAALQPFPARPARAVHSGSTRRALRHPDVEGIATSGIPSARRALRHLDRVTGPSTHAPSVSTHLLAIPNYSPYPAPSESDSPASCHHHRAPLAPHGAPALASRHPLSTHCCKFSPCPKRRSCQQEDPAILLSSLAPICPALPIAN